MTIEYATVTTGDTSITWFIMHNDGLYTLGAVSNDGSEDWFVFEYNLTGLRQVFEKNYGPFRHVAYCAVCGTTGDLSKYRPLDEPDPMFFCQKDLTDEQANDVWSLQHGR